MTELARRHALVVDDESDVREIVSMALQRAEMTVVEASSLSAARALVKSHHFDIVVLDLMLGDGSGFDFLHELRSEPATAVVPVIMLTARGDAADREHGLELGADDYVQKPFSPRELRLRVEAILRRGRSSEPALHCGNVAIVHQSARVEGQNIILSVLELRLLDAFLRNVGTVLARETLLTEVFGYKPGVESRTVDAHVKRLREKLGPEATVAIESVRGVGYRMTAP